MRFRPRTRVPSLRRVLAMLLLAATCGAAGSGQGRADDWTQFLGPQRNGISKETGLISRWPKEGLKERWRVRGGVGMSAVVVVDGKAITMIEQEGMQRVAAWSAKTGAPIWNTPIAPRYRNPQGNGPRATPAVAAGRVFVFTGEGILAAVSLKDGKLLWKKNTLKALGGRAAEFGMACSPLVVGDRVVITTGARGASTSAFAAKDGELVWKSGDDAAGYSSPALLSPGGLRHVVAFNGAAAIGLSPNDGRELWRYPFATDFACNIATPIQFGNHIFISAGENHGSSLLKLSRVGERFKVEEAWTSHGPKSVLRSAWQTSILDGHHLYGFDNVGAAGPIMHLTCIDIESGERVWRKTRFGKGNLIAADGKLFVSTMGGELIVLKINPERYEELGRMKVTGMTRQAPSLSDGLLYLRDDTEVVCLEAK